MIKSQQYQALISHFESFWSIVQCISFLGEYFVVQGRRKSLIEGLISCLLQSKQVLPVGGLVEGRSQRVFRKLTRNYRPGHSSKWKWMRGYFFYLMRIEKLTAQTIFRPLPLPNRILRKLWLICLLTNKPEDNLRKKELT